MCGAFFALTRVKLSSLCGSGKLYCTICLNFAETHMVGFVDDHCFSIVFKWLQAAQIYPPYKCRASRYDVWLFSRCKSSTLIFYGKHIGDVFSIKFFRPP